MSKGNRLPTWNYEYFKGNKTPHMTTAGLNSVMSGLQLEEPAGNQLGRGLAISHCKNLLTVEKK